MKYQHLNGANKMLEGGKPNSGLFTPHTAYQINPGVGSF
jgi:hypothetical protein